MGSGFSSPVRFRASWGIFSLPHLALRHPGGIITREPLFVSLYRVRHLYEWEREHWQLEAGLSEAAVRHPELQPVVISCEGKGEVRGFLGREPGCGQPATLQPGAGAPGGGHGGGEP